MELVRARPAPRHAVPCKVFRKLNGWRTYAEARLRPGRPANARARRGHDAWVLLAGLWWFFGHNKSEASSKQFRGSHLRMEQELRGESVKEDAGDMLGVKRVMGGGCASSITSESFKAASAQDAHAIEPE